MKRFINDYSILRAVRTLEGNAVGMASLALWAIIETRWPSLADLLCRRPEAIGAGRGAAAEPDGQRPIDDIPDDLRRLLADPQFRALASFHQGGPLTADLIAQCCGMRVSGTLDQPRPDADGDQGDRSGGGDGPEPTAAGRASGPAHADDRGPLGSSATSSGPRS
jgi:hypothetical protein